jgi:hypothetical protein
LHVGRNNWGTSYELNSKLSPAESETFSSLNWNSKIATVEGLFINYERQKWGGLFTLAVWLVDPFTWGLLDQLNYSRHPKAGHGSAFGFDLMPVPTIR